MYQQFKRTSIALFALTLLASACATGTESTTTRARNSALDATTCVPSTDAGKQAVAASQANVDKLAADLVKKKTAFNKAQRAFAKERKHKPSPREALLKKLYKKTKKTGNAWRKAEFNHSLELRSFASVMASQQCAQAQVVQTISQETAQVGAPPAVVSELTSGEVKKDGLETILPVEVTTTTSPNMPTTSTIPTVIASTSTLAPVTTTSTTSTTSTTTTTTTTPTTTTQAPKPSTTTSPSTSSAPTTTTSTTTTLPPIPTFSNGVEIDYGVFSEVVMSADGKSSALLDYAQVIARTDFSMASYRTQINRGISLGMSADGTRVGVGTGDGKVVLSDNSGKSFYPAISSPGSGVVVSVAIANNTDCFAMYIATVSGLYAGLFCPSNGSLVGKWRLISSSIYFEVKTSSDGKIAIALPLSVDQAIVSRNYGLNWAKVGSVGYMFSSWVSNDGQNMLMSEDGVISVSKDSGATWNILLQDKTYLPSAYHGLAARDDLTVIYAAERDGTILRRSTNSGSTWWNWKIDKSNLWDGITENVNVASTASANYALLIIPMQLAPAYMFFGLSNA